MKAQLHKSLDCKQGRDTGTIIPNVSCATPTKQMGKGVIYSCIQTVFNTVI